MKRVSRYIICLIVFSSTIALGQPMLQSKRLIEGVHVYRDVANPFLYYYEPGKITLAFDESNTPDFQFLDMRYTGSTCYNDAGTKSFMSLVQFGVVLEPVSSETLKKISMSTGNARSIQLKPLAVSHIHTRLIIPNTENDSIPSHIINDNGAFEADSDEGNTTSKSYWSKRTYTVRLNRFESQLLNKQLQDQLLGITLNYSFYADFWDQEEFITGNKALKRSITKDEEKGKLHNKAFNTNSLPISIDIKKFSRAIKQLDLNEEIPPAYAALEIRCYDFREQLRPDLFLKTVELEAESVNGNIIKGIEVKFSAKQTDLTTKHIQFPYAVNMGAPIRYRIKEISKSGTSKLYEWIIKPECSSIIDITSATEDQTIVPVNLDVEISSGYLDNDVKTVNIIINYKNNKQEQQETISFNRENDTVFQSITFKKDKNDAVFYQIERVMMNDSIQISEKKALRDNYLFISQNHTE